MGVTEGRPMPTEVLDADVNFEEAVEAPCENRDRGLEETAKFSAYVTDVESKKANLEFMWTDDGDVICNVKESGIKEAVVNKIRLDLNDDELTFYLNGRNRVGFWVDY